MQHTIFRYAIGGIACLVLLVGAFVLIRDTAPETLIMMPVGIREQNHNSIESQVPAHTLSVHSPPGDYCIFTQQVTDRVSAIYQRLEQDLRKYANMNQIQREELIDSCRNAGGSCSILSIRKGFVFVSKLGSGVETRHAEMLRHLQRVAEKFFPLPDLDFTIDTEDGSSDTGQLPRFMLCGFVQAPQGIMVPDFSFFDYPITKCPGEASHRFEDFISNATERSWSMNRNPWRFVNSKRNDIFWRGAPLNNPTRVKQLQRILETIPAYPETYNLKLMEWVSNTLDGNNTAKGCIKMHDHCDHRFLLHLQGNTYSSRLKYLLLCGSVVFMPQQEFEEWWYPAFPAADTVDEDNEVIVHVRKDMSDMHEKFSQYFHPNHATPRAVKTSQRTLNFALDVFSQQNVDCYWGTVLIGASRAWGTIMNGTVGRPLEEVLEDPLVGFNDL